MPCFFCIAVGGIVATATAAALADKMRERLQNVADGEVRVVDDNNEFTQRYELMARVPESARRRPGRGAIPHSVPVAVTVYPQHHRIRVQVRTHDVDRREAEEIEQLVVEALGMEVVYRSGEHEQHVVHEAIEHLRVADQSTTSSRPTRGVVDPER